VDLDPVLLSRFQFAWLIGWHILMPAFTVGMASYIAILEGLHFATGSQVYLRISMFWIRIFSVAFGVGVVSGVIMPFQFGTNWSRYADATSNVLGPLFAYEAINAFFLEAAFLGVLLFGRKLVPPWAHFLAALMVALGTLFSAFWILAANSWMQTPAGYEIIATGFVVVGVAAWLIRKSRSVDEARVMLSMTPMGASSPRIGSQSSSARRSPIASHTLLSWGRESSSTSCSMASIWAWACSTASCRTSGPAIL
jgi:cytochrome bd ubiquinol oxidase subunit I